MRDKISKTLRKMISDDNEIIIVNITPYRGKSRDLSRYLELKRINYGLSSDNSCFFAGLSKNQIEELSKQDYVKLLNTDDRIRLVRVS